MKGKLEFNLPEDNLEFEMALNGANLHSALDKIRNKIFHQLDEVISDQRRQIYDEIHTIILNECNANDISHLF